MLFVLLWQVQGVYNCVLDSKPTLESVSKHARVLISKQCFSSIGLVLLHNQSVYSRTNRFAQSGSKGEDVY